MKANKNKELPFDYLRECFDYNESSGLITWKVRPQSHFPTQKGCKVFNSRLSGKVAGYAHNRGYLAVNVNGYTYLVHRVCWALSTGEWPTEDVDHINGIKDDNRLVNLRVVTRGVNSRNQKLRSNNSTDCMGVTRDNNSFRVRVGTEGKRVSLGNFKTLDEAVEVRKNAESSYGFHENHGR